MILDRPLEISWVIQQWLRLPTLTRIRIAITCERLQNACLRGIITERKAVEE